MARPQNEGGDGLQTWTAGALILNNQLRTDDRRWSSIFGGCDMANNASSQKSRMLRKVTQGLRLSIRRYTRIHYLFDVPRDADNVIEVLRVM